MRRVSFTQARVNSQRSVSIVRLAPGGGSARLYPVQLDGKGRESAVAFTSCKVLWIGEVVPVTGIFAADLELDVWSATPIGMGDIVFVNASEVPRGGTGSRPVRCRHRQREPVCSARSDPGYISLRPGCF